MGRYGNNPIVKPDNMKSVYRKRHSSEGRRGIFFGGKRQSVISDRAVGILSKILLWVAALVPVSLVCGFLISFVDENVAGLFIILMSLSFVFTNLAVLVGGYVTDHRLKNTGLSMFLVWVFPLAGFFGGIIFHFLQGLW